MYKLVLEFEGNVKIGQFFMLKAEDSFMSLYRPISVYDYDGEKLSFLYSIRGRGTKLFSRLKAGDSLSLHGPYGNGFEATDKKLALVGGGIGIAPLYYTAKSCPNSKVYIGLREDFYSEEEIDNIRDLFTGVDYELVIGGFVTDAVDYSKYDVVYACGPEPMMLAAAKNHDNVYVSMERHMGCGIGACLSCSIKLKESDTATASVCKKGPVFNAREVDFLW